jgi:catechol 2,3-dioxygenase-like lactoylglutathione lyase family enzyme
MADADTTVADTLGAPYHIGMLVSDLDAARQTLGTALGIRWTEIYTVELNGYGARIAFSLDEPYLELCEGTPGSPWKSKGDGIELHHLGYWTSDFDRDAKRLEAAGLVNEWDGQSEGLGRKVAYYRLPNGGGLIELVDIARKEWLENLIQTARSS